MIGRDVIRPMYSRPRALIVAALVLLVSALRAQTPPALSAPPQDVTSPREQFGAAIGDDYFLASYTQLEEYWKARIPEIRGIMERSQGEMRALLTPAQRETFDRRVRDLGDEAMDTED